MLRKEDFEPYLRLAGMHAYYNPEYDGWILLKPLANRRLVQAICPDSASLEEIRFMISDMLQTAEDTKWPTK